MQINIAKETARIEELYVHLEVRTGSHIGDMYLYPTHYWFLLLLDEYEGQRAEILIFFIVYVCRLMLQKRSLESKSSR